jgi:hypothetical protein
MILVFQGHLFGDGELQESPGVCGQRGLQNIRCDHGSNGMLKDLSAIPRVCCGRRLGGLGRRRRRQRHDCCQSGADKAQSHRDC